MVQEYSGRGGRGGKRGQEPPGARGLKEFEDDAPTLIAPERPTYHFEESLIQSTDHQPHKPTVGRIELRTASVSTEEKATNQREITLIGGLYDPDTELPPESRISLTGQDATLIMAFDNDRFFDSNEADGYQDLLIDASQAMEHLAKSDTQSWSEPLPEMNWLGWLWRWFMIRSILRTTDSVNRLRITRFLQNSLAFMMAYESFALGSIISAFDVDDRSKDLFNLRLAFRNRNASRSMVQALRPRWDWLWHTGTSVSNSRWFDIFGLLPFIGITSFPATENFPSSKNHVINGILSMFFSGSWFTRWATGNQEGLVVFDSQTAAQNLAAEVNRFEASNRNQYGTSFGREKTVQFRLSHRLAIDESIVRSFQNTPATVIVNNGVEHVLRCLAKHWRNMLYQDNGNFAHQRMEQLNPFETLRFFMPIVLSTLANLRGRNVWDMTTLGPFIKRLQLLNPDKTKLVGSHGNDVERADYVYANEIHGPCQAALSLTLELKEKIIADVCGGVPTRLDPFGRWVDAIRDSIVELSRQAEEVKAFVATVDIGIKLGYQLMKLVNWRVPKEKVIQSAIINHILHKTSNSPDIPNEVIISTLQKLPPKDERTLKELFQKGLAKTEAAQLLLTRSATLLERELRRKALDERIRKFSKGPVVKGLDKLQRNKWYWVDDAVRGARVCVYKSLHDSSRLKMVDVEYNIEELVESGPGLTILQYIPVAEAISRAQKVFMTVEIDHGKKFSYNAYMEFGSTSSSNSLRTRLRRLLVVSQIHCSELDKARLNVLAEIKSSVQRMRKSPKFAASRLVPECKPQNLTVFGGGPTGLLGAIHCLQNVILSGGQVRIFEGRDTFAQGGAAFQRAQIVRLDARQISMIRYHLGTGYEDVFIPGKGETDAHHGNTLASQAFVEVTIKRMEIMILDEVINLRSKGLLEYYTDSKVYYNALDCQFKKLAGAMKEGDRFFLDNEVVDFCDFVYPTRVSCDALVEGAYYDIALPLKKETVEYRLVSKREDYDWYHFSPNKQGYKDVQGSYGNLPPIYYPNRVSRDTLVEGASYFIALPREKEPVEYRLVSKRKDDDLYHFSPIKQGYKDVQGSYGNLPPIYTRGDGLLEPEAMIVETSDGSRKEIKFDKVKKTQFLMDFSGSHVMAAIGKPNNSPTHISFTTKEPYAVCCVEGIKVSMGMHSFGVPRWGRGIVDDLRSRSDQNTRIIGDFTKSVNLLPICGRMHHKMKTDQTWIVHFDQLPRSVDDEVASLPGRLLEKLAALCAIDFHRKRLQTRFFELGNNYYLGMEFTREYDKWKNDTIEEIAPSHPENASDLAKANRTALQDALKNRIDRLWYESCLEIIHEGDVYNPGGRGQIPKLYLIPSPFEQKLGDLKELESFRLFPRGYRVQSQGGDGTTVIRSEFDMRGLSLPSETYVFVRAINEKKSLTELAVNDTFEPIDVFEVVSKRGSSSVIRNSRGYVAILSNDVRVGRESDLSRAPDGYSESVVAMASFPVAHTVSHRTVHVNRVSGKAGDDGYVTAYVGDAQASPHFMRYSGLTGACINCMSFNNMIAHALQGVPFEYRVQRYAFETNWSNGEVVQRGTGANYGDGFLRPGFTYKELVKYLYARVCEHIEINADIGAILTRDWKIKVAASIMPRGLENDARFYESLLGELQAALREKFAFEVSRVLGVPVDKLTDEVMTSISNEMDEITGKGPSIVSAENIVVKNVGILIGAVLMALKDTIDYSVELRSGNGRLPSELYNQSAAIDTIVDDFAVEAQNFANALTQSAAFTAAVVALGSNDAGQIAGALLGVWNIGVSFNSMTNVSRYKNRNEETRRSIFDKKLNRMMKSVFSLMTRDQRDKFNGTDEDPYLFALNHYSSIFVQKCRYYNIPEANITVYKNAYDDYMRSKKDQARTVAFIHLLVTKFIAGIFHESSYLQEDLVNIYKELYEILDLAKKSPSNGIAGAIEVYRNLLKFKAALQVSIQRGDIKYGFLRSCDWHQTALPVFLKNIFSPILGGTTIGAKTWAALKGVESLRSADPSVEKLLSRPIRDLTELYFATKESEISSMGILSSYMTFTLSWIFTIIRIIEISTPEREDGESSYEVLRILINVAQWASLGTLLGAFIAVFHFFRKLKHLSGLVSSLTSRRVDPRIQKAITVTRTQQFITIVRFLSVVGSSVALTLWILVDTFDSGIPNDRDIVSFIAMGGVALAIASALLFVLFEFSVRYTLEPRLGRVLCEPFRDEIERIKNTYSRSTNALEFETTQVIEKDTWEYTAREFLHKYRFDTVFAADRFGTIVQHIQSGNKMD